jgi:hypothetical protein
MPAVQLEVLPFPVMLLKCHVLDTLFYISTILMRFEPTKNHDLDIADTLKGSIGM